MRNRCVTRVTKNRYFKTGLVSSKIADDSISKNLPEAGRGLSPLSHFLATRETSVSREAEILKTVKSFYPHPPNFYFVGGEGVGSNMSYFGHDSWKWRGDLKGKNTY